MRRQCLERLAGLGEERGFICRGRVGGRFSLPEASARRRANPNSAPARSPHRPRRSRSGARSARTGRGRHNAVDDGIALADEDGRAEAARADRIRHIEHVSRVELRDLARRHAQVLERDVHEMMTFNVLWAERPYRSLAARSAFPVKRRPSTGAWRKQRKRASRSPPRQVAWMSCRNLWLNFLGEYAHSRTPHVNAERRSHGGSCRRLPSSCRPALQQRSHSQIS
jgi:hypothetical protein